MNIYDGDQVLATVRKFAEWQTGLDFVTDDEKFIQVGTWNYNSGKRLDRHEHNIVDRNTNLTQECVFVVTGSMNVSFYSSMRVFIKKVMLKQFDFAVIYGGGHAYEILEDDTKIIEIKNGPFPGVDIDKTRF